HRRSLHAVDPWERWGCLSTVGLYAERRPALALRRHGAARRDRSRFQGASPLGPSSVPRGERLLVLTSRIVHVVSHLPRPIRFRLALVFLYITQLHVVHYVP